MKYLYSYNTKLKGWEVKKRFFFFWYRDMGLLFSNYKSAKRWTGLNWIQKATDPNSPLIKKEL